MPKIPGKQIQLDSNPELGTSDVVVSSQRAIKEYVDTKVANNAAVIYTYLIPAGTPSPAVVTHNLNSYSYFVNVYDNVSKEDIVVSVDRIDPFNVEIDYTTNENEFVVLIFSTTLVEPVAGTAGIASAIVAVDNGLTSSNGVGKLGGELLQDTTINGDAFNLTFTTVTGSVSSNAGENGVNASEVNVSPDQLQFSSYINTTTYTSFDLLKDGHSINTQDMSSGDYVRLELYNGTDNPLSFLITGTSPLFAGAEYAADYSANYTDRSLVDKEYVDNAITSGGWVITGTTVLTGNVVIDAASNTLNFENLSQFYLEANNIQIDASDSFQVTSNGAGINLTNSSAYNEESYGTRIYTINNDTFIGNDTSYLRINSIDTDGALMHFQTAAYTLTFGDDVLAYGADYSADYTNRSLVDKEYVDSVAGGGGGFGLMGEDKFLYDDSYESSYEKSFTMVFGSDNLTDYNGPLDTIDPHSFSNALKKFTVQTYGSSPDSFIGLKHHRYNGGEEHYGDGEIQVNGSNISLVSTGIYKFYYDNNQLDLGEKTGLNVSSGGVTISVSNMDDSTTYGKVTFSTDGFRYDADYSAGFNDRSLVDKAYVDSVAGGSGWPLSGTATLTDDVTINGAGGTYGVSLGGSTNPLSNFTMYSNGAAQFNIQDNYNISTNNGGGKTASLSISPGSTAFSFIGSNPGSSETAVLYAGNNDEMTGTFLVSSSNFQSSISLQPPAITLLHINQNTDVSAELRISATQSYFSNTDNLPLEYEDDYSMNYTDRSLVDKAYVDNAIHGTSGLGNPQSNVVNVSIFTASTYTATQSTHYLQYNGGTATAIDLPAVPRLNQQIVVSDITGAAATNVITINGNGYLINGSSSASVNTNYGSLMLIFNGINWVGLGFTS